MNKTITILFIVILFYVVFFSFAQASSQEMVIKISFDDKESAYQKLKPLRLTFEDVRENWARAIVDEIQFEKIVNMGFYVQVLYRDVRIRSAEWKEALGPKWTSYADVVTTLQSIALAHPNICRLHNIGQSVQGRDIYVMEITDNPDIDETDEAEVRLIGNIHGNEYISLELMVLMIQYLTDNYGIIPAVTNVVNTREIWIQPSVNPDGHENGTRGNAHGVDMNRNHGYMWNYGGSGPFSEIELQHFREYSLIRNFSMSLTFHGVTTYFNYCWNFTGYDAFDKAHLHALGQQYTSWNGYINTEGYDWYQTNGDTNDWSYGCRGSFDVTIETPGSSAGDLTQDWNDNRDAMMYIIEQAGYGLSGVVRDSQTNLPLEAIIKVHQHPMFVYTDPVGGDYHRPLQAGTYDITVWANGYSPMTVNSIGVLSQQITTQDIYLDANYEHYALHVCWNSIHSSYVTSASSWYGIWPHEALGPPDMEAGSLGRECELALDMGEGFEISDMPGNDLIVYEADVGDGDEQFTLYGSSDGFLGPWVLIGSGLGTTEFDLNGTGLASVRYLKFEDNTSGSFYNYNPGFDLDAVGAIPQQPGCGIIMLDETSYTCDDQPVSITVVDEDLNTHPLIIEYVDIIIWSDTQPAGETVRLNEISASSDTFQGTITLSETQSGGGYLQVSRGDTITSQYDDADCQGSPRTVTDTALAICDDPVLLISSFIIDDSTGDNDGVADPGETVQILVSLENTGTEAAMSVQGVLSENSSSVTVSDNSATWPDINPGNSEQSLPDHFTLEVQPSAPIGETVLCSLIVSAIQYNAQLEFTIHISQKPLLVIDDSSNSANIIKTDLENLGYPVDIELASETDPTDWSNYEFIVWSCGHNLSPVSQSGYRTSLENHVAAGYHLWIEGGELGYDSLSSPGYPSFASNVLHANTWTTDSSGNITIEDDTHPLVMNPNILSQTINCSYSSYGDQDAVIVDSTAYRICSWSGQTNASSMIAFDQDSDPDNGGNIVFTSFDFEELDQSDREAMVENITYWLSSSSGSQQVPTVGPLGVCLVLIIIPFLVKRRHK